MTAETKETRWPGNPRGGIRDDRRRPDLGQKAAPCRQQRTAIPAQQTWISPADERRCGVMSTVPDLRRASVMWILVLHVPVRG